MLSTLTKTNEQLALRPEEIEVISLYVECGFDAAKAAQVVGMHVSDYKAFLERPTVKAYITTQAVEAATRSSSKMSDMLHELIQAKMLQMAEDETTSSKDIADLIQMQHKLEMDRAKLAIEAQKAQHATKVTNTQINISGYDTLIKNLTS